MSHFRNPEGISHIQGMDVLYLGHVIQRLAKSQYLMEPQEYDADSRPFLEDLLRAIRFRRSGWLRAPRASCGSIRTQPGG